MLYQNKKAGKDVIGDEDDKRATCPVLVELSQLQGWSLKNIQFRVNLCVFGHIATKSSGHKIVKELISAWEERI